MSLAARHSWGSDHFALFMLRTVGIQVWKPNETLNKDALCVARSAARYPIEGDTTRQRIFSAEKFSPVCVCGLAVYRFRQPNASQCH
jgi:hypothetical protein